MFSITDILSVFVCSLLTLKICNGEELLHSVHGSIGAENYTYYKTFRPGRLRLELTSLTGDADLYVSTEILNPTYNEYTAQSITCGKDSIEIPATYERPIGIGIFGHPNFEQSTYVLSIYLLAKDEEMDYEQFTLLFHDYEAADYLFTNYEASDYMFRDAKPRMQGHNTKQNKAESREDYDNTLDDDDPTVGSVLWEILITLLKVVFEVIL
ncbi:hypothetical protein ACF0H5_002151 [Mactra antiquata]